MSQAVAFVSLFLGLVTGPQPVELAVGVPAATVELRLDGAVEARFDGIPLAVCCSTCPSRACIRCVTMATQSHG